MLNGSVQATISQGLLTEVKLTDVAGSPKVQELSEPLVVVENHRMGVSVTFATKKESLTEVNVTFVSFAEPRKNKR